MEIFPGSTPAVFETMIGFVTMPMRKLLEIKNRDGMSRRGKSWSTILNVSPGVDLLIIKKNQPSALAYCAETSLHRGKFTENSLILFRISPTVTVLASKNFLTSAGLAECACAF